MALIKCHECGREISDQANVCPQCGAPARSLARPAAVQQREAAAAGGGLGWGVVILAAVVMLGFMFWGAVTPVRPDVGGSISDQQRTPAPPPPPSPAIEAAQRAALEQFKGMPGIRHTEWLDGDFIIAARDNNRSWQPVAEAACAWIRRRGHTGRFSVVVLEAGALQNKRWSQLARARCN